MYNNYIRGGYYGASGAFPDNPEIEDYEKLYPEDYEKILEICISMYIIHVACFMMSCICITNDKLERYVKITMSYIIVNIVVVTCIYFFQEEDYKVCRYPFNCEKGVNDSIVPSYYYYAIKDSKEYCPPINKIVNNYLEKKNLLDKECEESEYGCCEYTTMCYVYSELDYKYSVLEYDINNDILIKKKTKQKKNKEGDNCVIQGDGNWESYGEVLVEYLDKKENILIGIYITLYIIIYLILLIQCKIKEEKDKEYVKVTGIV